MFFPYSVRRESTREEILNSSRDKIKARTVVGMGEEEPLCDPGFELLLGGAREQCEDNKRNEKKEEWYAQFRVLVSPEKRVR